MDTYKGTAIEYVRRALKERGEAAEQQFRDKLKPEEVALFESVLPLNWVSVEVSGRIMEAASTVLYPQEEPGIRLLGRDMARDNLTGIYKILLRLTTVAYAVGKVSSLWSTYHRKGNARIEWDGSESRGAMIVEGYPELPQSIRETIAGYLVGVMELTGAKNIRSEVDSRDPSAWRWTISWD